jgi:hypothetical protein
VSFIQLGQEKKGTLRIVQRVFLFFGGKKKLGQKRHISRGKNKSESTTFIYEVPAACSQNISRNAEKLFKIVHSDFYPNLAKSSCG